MTTNQKTQQTAQGGVGLPGLLFLTFLILKLTGVIDWSWWWITAPLWGCFALAAVVVLIVLLFALIAGLTRGKR